jgi:NADPH:quinone reductase-like Zn-dependent oxidoreductase
MTMKAVRIHDYGGPDVLVYEDVPRPRAGPGEILIRVHAAAVNPLDWKVREGHLKDMLKHRLPLIPGWDVSGVVESGAGVAGYKVGNGVYGLLDIGKDGAHAEYVVTQPTHLAPKPRTVGDVRAASVPVAGLTAWQTLFEAGGLSAGQRVLIHGAGGSVGGFAVQFAKHAGAYVVAAANGPDLTYVSSLGADQALDYAAAPFEDVVKDVDLVLDVIGGGIQERSLKVLRRGGILVSTLGISVSDEAASRSIEAKAFFVRPDSAQLAEIAGLIDAGKIRLNVGTILPLEKAREAHELVQSGRPRGKVVLKVM